MPEFFKEILKFIPTKNKEEFKVLPNLYEIELRETKKELVESLYELKDELHPEFLFSSGQEGTLNDLNWLLEHKKDFEEGEKDAYFKFRYKLQNLSNTFAEMLFGEFVDQPFESELVYSIVSSSLKKMGIKSYLRDEEEKELELDLSPIGKGRVGYKLTPWISGIEKNAGKILDEYYLENKLKVEIGLKPSVFRSLSSGITTPTHEILHHVSNLYNSDAFSLAVSKAFNESFKDLPIFRIFRDKGMLFGSVDKKLREKLEQKEIDIRGKDLTNPFIFWEIVRRHGIEISDISKIPLNKLYEACFSYISKSLPFKILEEGIASYLSIENACIEDVPKEFAGLENSLKSLVKFGAKLRKLEYLERGIGFYTGEKFSAPYYLPEFQVYPLAYLYVAQQVDLHKPKGIKWYLDFLRDNYLRRGLTIPPKRFVKKKRLEEVSPRLAQERRLQAMMNEINQNIQNYRKRLNEIDRLLKEYKNQLNQIRRLENRSFNSRNYRPRNFIRIENDETLRNVIWLAAGTLSIYAFTKFLDRYLSS
ncbi:MAG: hypothetical protein DRP00_04260 [Candidatus Aenigmatarchaeota archaeon]|nr:MAG: hypothetical protein DRP00_04260 [Candidatus Aenigmarchaeota archaeon]